MLLILLLRDPQLMEAAQTRQDTSAYPGGILALHNWTGRNQPVLGRWEQSINLKVETLVELVQ